MGVIMAETVNVKNVGLRGVTVADTKISFIDGENGILIYRGYRIEQLAEASSFMEVAFLILNGHLPHKKALIEFENKVKEAREIPEYVVDVLKNCPKNAEPMDVLQAAVSLLAMADPDIKVRAYLDGRLAEAMSLAGDHQHAELRRLMRKNRGELDARWRRNVILNKWLEYLSDQGHLILER